jgi:hypothetical protein
MFTLVLLPWIALAIVNQSHGLFHVDGYWNDAHPNVAIALLAPAFILVLRSTDFEIVYSNAIVGLSAAVGILLFLGAVKVDPTLRTRRGSLVALFVLFLAYGYGAIIEANVLFDQTPGVIYTAPVVERRVVAGKNTRYKLRVGPWGPKAKQNEIRVERATYQYIRPGNVVKLVLKRGELGIKWYYLLSWDTGPAENDRTPR